MSAPAIVERGRSVGTRDTASGNLVDALAPFERALAAALLMVLAPALVVLFAIVRLLSHQAPLIMHERVGLFGETFWMLKLRTMWDARHDTKSAWIQRIAASPVPPCKAIPDPRVTSRFAAICRKYSIDELPQLLHVVTGRMSFVGPRPLTRAELDTYYRPYQAAITSVKPGLSGLWQVSGRSRLNYHQRLRLDRFYVEKRSVGLYLRILAKTPAQVVTGKNAT